MKRTFIITTGVLIVALGLLLYQILWAPNTFEGERIVTISKGETFSQVVDSLEQAGVIRSRLMFEVAGRILGLTTKMQIGRYCFTSGISNKEILDDLKWGRSVLMIKVVIPEGLKATRQARILSRELGIDSSRFMTLVFDSNFARTLNVDSPTLEGYLMPSTYRFYWQTDEEKIIEQMVTTFWNVVNDTLRRRASNLGYSLHEVLTLASIVEGETKIDSERAVVAGVYLNRLKKRMRLQADPTIQYIIEGEPRRLRYSDLQQKSAYNTYFHYGLPPGPVNNPGIEAIIAVLYPKTHKYLYFVATGKGGHVFTRTYSEHQLAVRKYRKYLEQQRKKEEN